MRDTVLVLDFGGQYNQLIARRVREHNVFCELLPYSTSLQKIEQIKPCGIILSGGPNSVYQQDSPVLDQKIYELGIPILGICYGGQLIAKAFGGTVSRGASEYGTQQLTYTSGPLFDGIKKSSCLMSHSDYIQACPNGFVVSASTDACPVAAFENQQKRLFGVQFHPEVTHTEFGNTLIKNFLFNICGAKGDWTMSNFASQSVAALAKKIGDKKVLCALSGGVDSSVVAALIDKACKNLICVFVDHGLMRKNEADEVERIFKHERHMNFIRVNAADRFLTKLKGVVEPEQKRKIIGEEFIRVFEDEAKKIGSVDFLAQGTIYADVVESGKGGSAVIKSHHNVGGLPSVIDFKEIIEPLRELFKDEVRQCGLELGLPKELVMRQPFPGPGLAVRIIGEITPNRLQILRDADAIFTAEIAKAGLNEQIWQYFAVLTPIKSVGVMGDYRTYSNTVALRAVTSIDAMTASVARIPYEVLESAANKIINQVEGVNRVVYDITSKPPATIEWE